ncbi:MAG: RIP metalloprotease [Hyphomicrobiaceae bacterium]|nr:RIP metalloprotease [Hyphomicrobiaceae bacterium]
MTLLQMSLPPFNLLAWLPVIMIVIFIHELGHFLVARWCGVKVATFSIGFGTELYHRYDRHGTRWRLAAIPIGGYVKFAGDDNAASVPSPDAIAKMSPEERAGAFPLKPLWQRAAVVAAGPAANFLSAILIFAAVAYFAGINIQPKPTIEVQADSPAARSGMKTGDVVDRIDGRDIKDFTTLLRVMSTAPLGRELKVEVLRDGQPLTLMVRPEQRTVDDGFGGKDTRPMLGVRAVPDKSRGTMVQPGVVEALGHGVNLTWTVITDTINAMLHPQFLQKVSGLPTMIDVSNKVATFGLLPTLQLIALLSVSIGFINLLPIPILDGGHLMFYAAEAVRGKPLSEQAQEFGFRIGFALVCSLMLLALWNDRFRVCRWVGLDCSS